MTRYTLEEARHIVIKGLNIYNLAIPDSIMAKLSLEENNKK